MHNSASILRVVLMLGGAFGKLESLPITGVRNDGNQFHTDGTSVEIDRSLWSDLLSDIGKESKSPQKSPSDTISNQLGAVDSIEDAILAALETVKVQDIPSTSTKTPISNGIRMRRTTRKPIRKPELFNTVGPDPNSENLENFEVVEVEGQEVTSSTTEPPGAGDYFAGIFGSLGAGNLGGVIENTIRLAGSGAVQTILSGLTDTLTCQITPGCRVKQPKK